MRRILYTVLMLHHGTKFSDKSECVSCKRGPGVSRHQDHVLEHEMVQNYASSKGLLATSLGVNLPKGATPMGTVSTYRSFDRNGNGRSASTITRYTLYIKA